MPKEKPITTEIKAKNRTKAYIESGLNQSEMARRLGKARSTINQQVHKPAVVDKLQKFLDSKKLDKKLIQVAEEGLDATKTISCYVIVKPNIEPGAQVGEPNLDIKSIPADQKTMDFIDVPDHNNRHKFFNTIMEAKNKIKAKPGGEGTKIINVIYGYRECQTKQT